VQIKLLQPVDLTDRSLLPGAVVEVDGESAARWIAAGRAIAAPMEDGGSALLTEAELARLANRSSEYIRTARQRGFIAPAMRTSGGIFLYLPATVATVRGIVVPVMRPRARFIGSAVPSAH